MAAGAKLTEVEHSLSNTLTKYVAYATGYFDAVKVDGSRGVNWKHVGVVGAVALGVSALTTLSILQFYRPFPRGKRQRAIDSRPFRDDFVLPKELEHQFYMPDEFQFIQLSQGRVRYFLRHRGPRSEKVVVLVHGFSIPSDIWKQQADYLVQQGHTVLSFDNYGRGWSDAPDNIAYDQELYIGQLAELLFALQITKPIDLIGVSMGGAIVASFTARYPQAVARLCFVCPAGLPIATPAAMSKIMSRPVLGPYLFKKAIPHMQERGAPAQWEVKDSLEYQAWGEFAKQNILTHDGFVRTLYRTVVEYPMVDQRANFDVIGAQAHLRGKILILWGEKDGLTPYRNGALLQSLLPQSQLVTIVDAKHNFIIERPRPVNEILAAWLADEGRKLPARVRDSVTEGEQ